MHPTHAGAAAPKHITALHEFFKSGDGNLFAVRRGARTVDTLQQASCFLEVAHDAIDRLAAESESLQAYGVQYLLTFARAAVGAAEASVFHDECAAKSRPQEPPLTAVLESLLEESRRGVSEGRTKRGQTFHTGRVSALEEVLEHVRGMSK